MKNKEMLKRISCYLLDLDGTVNLGEKLINGALDFFHEIKKQKKQFLFATNNSTMTKAQYVAKFTLLGVKLTEDNVLTSGDALIHLLQKQKPGAHVYSIGTPTFEGEMEKAGFSVHHRPEKCIDLVTIAFDHTLTYEKLADASKLVCAGVPYVSTSSDLRCPVPGGAFIPDCGLITEVIEKTTDVKPLYFAGKPGRTMLEMAASLTGLAFEQMAVVGDRLYTDIRMAYDHGATGILVLTGEATREDAACSPTKPHLIYEDIGELASAIRDAG